MRLDEVLDDNDDDEWASALVRAAQDAEEEEWEWRIAMARARVAIDDTRIAKLPAERPPAPPEPPPPSRAVMARQARKAMPKPPPIPARPPRAVTCKEAEDAPPPRRRRTVSTEMPFSPAPAVANLSGMALAVTPARVVRPPVVIPPKGQPMLPPEAAPRPRRFATGTAPIECPTDIAEDEAAEMLRVAFARYVNED